MKIEMSSNHFLFPAGYNVSMMSIAGTTLLDYDVEVLRIRMQNTERDYFLVDHRAARRLI